MHEQTVKLQQWIRHFGRDPISCALLQDDLRYLETSYGMLAYRKVHGVDITLGPPLTAECDKKDLVRQFLLKSKKPVLNYLEQCDVHVLSGIDLKTVCIGSERWVDLDGFVAAPSTQVQSANKKADRAGLILKEVCFDPANKDLKHQLDSINQSFLQRAKYNQEMSFINRPFDWQDDGMRRLFVIEKYDKEHQGIFGYAVLNPFYQHSRVDGYLLDIIRFDRTRLWGVWLSVVSQLANIMQQQNYRFSLGFCPLHRSNNVSGNEPKEYPALRLQMKVLSRFLSSVHYIERLASRKSQIQGQDTNRYMMSYTSSCLKPMQALLAACDIHTPKLYSAELFRSIAKGFRLGRADKNPVPANKSVSV